MSRNLSWVIFTDVDGTLLDHDSYGFEPARPALEDLAARRIPVVLCSSKTRAELEEVRTRLDNSDPFVVENGGAAFIPAGYFPFSVPEGRESGAYLALEFGVPYEKLRQALARIRAELGGGLRGFGDMTADEVARLCGFSCREAELARRREYDEPFVVEDRVTAGDLSAAAARLGLRTTRGGRFFHLTGDNDKGRAVRALRALYERSRGPVRTVGIGDSLNDLPLLESVDVAVLVQKPDGAYDPDIGLPGLIRAPGPGPAGWNAAVR
ncbi:MAG: HAD-IIB family hydrolase, partial [Candidatus Aminicenantes bacterium]|nr:HAD-IIB family hydrolase [Candidatus Aminicenantes bacterium]